MHIREMTCEQHEKLTNCSNMVTNNDCYFSEPGVIIICPDQLRGQLYIITSMSRVILIFPDQVTCRLQIVTSKSRES